MASLDFGLGAAFVASLFADDFAEELGRGEKFGRSKDYDGMARLGGELMYVDIREGADESGDCMTWGRVGGCILGCLLL